MITIDFLLGIGESVRNLKRDELDEAGGLFCPSLYYAFFQKLAEKIKPNLAVVLGVCGGGDSYHICKGNPESTVVGVDIARDHEEQMLHIEANYQGFKFWLGDSVESAQAVSDKYGKIDLLFVDTSHTEGQTIAEWEAWKPFLNAGAVVCFDDIFRPGMQEAYDALPEPKVRMDYLHDGDYPHGGGFGALVYQG